jgi:hypothetical protein
VASCPPANHYAQLHGEFRLYGHDNHNDCWVNCSWYIVILQGANQIIFIATPSGYVWAENSYER